MKTYKVWIDQSAERDLQKIFRYISDTLNSPETAQRIYLSIREQIRTLQKFLMRCKIVDEEPCASQGIHQMPVENYTVFYLIHEESHDVHVFRILYNRRNWTHLLH